MKPTRTLPALLAAVLAAGCALLAPAEGDAQTIPSPYRFIENGQEAGAFIGYLGTGTGTFDLGPRSATIVGLRYGIHVNGPINFEGWASYIPTSRSIIDPRNPPGERKVGEADMNLALLEGSVKFSLMGHRTWNGIGPYVLAGGGLIFEASGDERADLVLSPEDRFDFSSSFIGHLGAGARWLPSSSFALRADARFSLWKLDTPEGYFDTGLELENPTDSEWVSGVSVTLGAALLF